MRSTHQFMHLSLCWSWSCNEVLLVYLYIRQQNIPPKVVYRYHTLELSELWTNLYSACTWIYVPWISRKSYQACIQNIQLIYQNTGLSLARWEIRQKVRLSITMRGYQENTVICLTYWSDYSFADIKMSLFIQKNG